MPAERLLRSVRGGLRRHGTWRSRRSRNWWIRRVWKRGTPNHGPSQRRSRWIRKWLSPYRCSGQRSGSDTNTRLNATARRITMIGPDPSPTGAIVVTAECNSCGSVPAPRGPGGHVNVGGAGAGGADPEVCGDRAGGRGAGVGAGGAASSASLRVGMLEQGPTGGGTGGVGSPA